MSLAAVMMICAAVTLTSCGGDDSKSTILTGTTWEGAYEEIQKVGNNTNIITISMTYKFYEDTYTTNLSTARAPYSMSADNKTVYMTADSGTVTGVISSDGKTMTVSKNGISFTLTKK